MRKGLSSGRSLGRHRLEVRVGADRCGSCGHYRGQANDDGSSILKRAEGQPFADDDRLSVPVKITVRADPDMIEPFQ